MEAGAQIVLSTLQLVLAGISIGVLMAAPIGPVNVLVIQRAVAGGFWAGLAAGIGAVLGDGLLAAIAAFSVTAISDVDERLFRMDSIRSAACCWSASASRCCSPGPL